MTSFSLNVSSGEWRDPCVSDHPFFGSQGTTNCPKHMTYDTTGQTHEQGILAFFWRNWFKHVAINEPFMKSIFRKIIRRTSRHIWRFFLPALVWRWPTMTLFPVGIPGEHHRHHVAGWTHCQQGHHPQPGRQWGTALGAEKCKAD